MTVPLRDSTQPGRLLRRVGPGYGDSVSHETLAVFLAVVAVLIIAGFARIAYLTRDIGRMVKAVAPGGTKKPRRRGPACRRGSADPHFARGLDAGRVATVPAMIAAPDAFVSD